MDLMKRRREILAQGNGLPNDILSGATWIEGSYLYANGAVGSHQSAKYTETYVPVEAGASYTVKAQPTGTAIYDRFIGYDSAKQYVECVKQYDWASGGEVTETFTMPSNISFIRVSTEILTQISMYKS